MTLPIKKPQDHKYLLRSHALAIAYVKRVKPRSILELGCHEGTFINEFSDLRITCHGVDLDGTLIDKARKKNYNSSCIFHCQDNNEFLKSWDGPKFDLIAAFDTPFDETLALNKCTTLLTRQLSKYGWVTYSVSNEQNPITFIDKANTFLPTWRWRIGKWLSIREAKRRNRIDHDLG